MIPAKQQLTIRHVLAQVIRDPALQSEHHRGASTTLGFEVTIDFSKLFEELSFSSYNKALGIGA